MSQSSEPRPRTRSPLQHDTDALLPAAAYLSHDPRRNGWTAGRQAAFLTHLADNGVVADAARSVGMSLAGAYAMRRKAAGYAFNLGWEAALLIARRIVADQLMTAAIKGEEARWVREEGVTTYTRHNPKLALTLLDRVTEVESLGEVLAVAAGFDWFVQLIDDRVSAAELWQLFFDSALPQHSIEVRDRVRAGLLLADESAISEAEGDQWDEDEAVEYKSLATGRLFPASHALSIGLINEIHQPEALDTAIDALAAEIATKAGSVLRRGKAAFTRQLGLPLAEAYVLARSAALENIVDPDAREGIAAFLEKRQPNWKS